MPNTDTRGILAVITDPAVRAELDRVAAAVGMRVVHTKLPLSRRAWSAAAAVVLDESAARHCGQSRLVRHEFVVVVCGGDPQPATWAAAIDIGARRVFTLPDQEHELVRELAVVAETAHDDGRRGAVLAVIGGCGGAGASIFAVALALTAPQPMLIDLDPWAGGLDLAVGAENARGVRWPDLSLQGGRLASSAVRDALPQHRGMSLLSHTREAGEPDGAAVHAVLDAGRRGGATVVCDLARRMTSAVESALETAALVVVVTSADVRSCAAASAMMPTLAAVNSHIGLVVRGPSPGGLRAAEIARIAGAPLLASMRPHPGLAEQLEHGGLRLGRRSALGAAARRVLAVLSAEQAPGGLAA